MKKILVIDTYNFLHRAYHALPKTFTNKEGEPTNAVYGVTSMLISIFSKLTPDYAFAALDSKEPTLRHEDFTGYKAHRRPMDDDLSSQIPKVLEIIDAFDIKSLALPGYEADDLIGTVVNIFSNKYEIIIVSNDRDLWQLIDENVVVMVPSTNPSVSDMWIREEEVYKKYGFSPQQIIDYKALRGDPSDNIPGVHGIGDKTATKLISEYKSVEEIYKNIGKIVPESLRNKLAQNYEEAMMSKKLATVIRDVPLKVNLSECTYSGFNSENVKDILTKHNFKSLLKRLGLQSNETTASSKEQVVPENQLKLF